VNQSGTVRKVGVFRLDDQGSKPGKDAEIPLKLYSSQEQDPEVTESGKGRPQKINWPWRSSNTVDKTLSTGLILIRFNGKYK
jgi:hypothetical protein